MAKFEQVPEEKLLNLIEKGEDFAGLQRKRKNKASSIFGKIGKVKRIWALPLFIYRAVKAKISKLKKNTGSKETSLRPVIGILTIVAVALLGYLITDFLFRSPDITDIGQRVAVIEDLPEEEAGSQERSFLSYSEMVQKRNIFSPVEVEDTEVVERKAEAELEEELRELAANLRVAGISLLPEPRAMIENTKTNETFFLKKGDTINKLTLDQIFADRIVLEYQGETLELF